MLHDHNSKVNSRGFTPATSRDLMVKMWNLYCLADLDIILLSDPLQTFVSSLSELVHPISCFKELWEFVLCFSLPKPPIIFHI